jgi:hypothetical protein
MRCFHAGLACAVLLTVAVCAVEAAQCSPPRFQVVRDFTNAARGIGLVHLTILPRETTVEKLACLAEVMSKRLAWATDVQLFVFNDREAAERFGIPRTPAMRWSSKYLEP